MGFFDALKDMFTLDSFYAEEASNKPGDVVPAAGIDPAATRTESGQADPAATRDMRIVNAAPLGSYDNASVLEENGAPQFVKDIAARGGSIPDQPTREFSVVEKAGMNIGGNTAPLRTVEQSSQAPMIEINGVKVPDLNGAPVMPDVTAGRMDVPATQPGGSEGGYFHNHNYDTRRAVNGLVKVLGDRQRQGIQ